MLLFFYLVQAQWVHAASLTVDTLLDENDGSCSDDDCSLRDAIQVANGGDTITFSVTGTIILTLGQLNVDKNLVISGPGPVVLTVSGTNTSRVFYTTGEEVTISGMTLANGDSGDNGGGLNNNIGCSVRLTNVTFTGNSATGLGGGLYNKGTATLTNVTFSDNSASDKGGGMYNDEISFLTNVTFTDNIAPSGGGMFDNNNSTLTNVTISGNSASDRGGGVATPHDSLITLKNTILSGNTAPAGPDCSGMLNSNGYNLIQRIRGCTVTGDQTSNLYGKDPLLGPLQDNGGATFTRALLPGSPAIDSGDTTDRFGNPVSQDQRGVSRPQGPTSDMGAYEVVKMSIPAKSIIH